VAGYNAIVNYQNDLVTIESYFTDSQKFTISIVGLKPNTDHKFMMNGEDKTSLCRQIRSKTAAVSSLRSDENGSLDFDYYYDAGIDEATSDLEQQNKLAASVAGQKKFSVESADGNSFASGTITIKSYIQSEISDTVNKTTVGAQVDTQKGSSLAPGEEVSATTNNPQSNIKDPTSVSNNRNERENFVEMNLSGTLADVKDDGSIPSKS
jgi:hypothetical protein